MMSNIFLNGEAELICPKYTIQDGIWEGGTGRLYKFFCHGIPVLFIWDQFSRSNLSVFLYSVNAWVIDAFPRGSDISLERFEIDNITLHTINTEKIIKEVTR